MKIFVLILYFYLVRDINGHSDFTIENLMEFLDDGFQRINSNVEMHPDTGLNISEFLEKYNYPLEFHEVPTEDGFILTVHRIPYGFNEAHKNDVDKPAVLFVHGLMCSSMDWIYLGPNNSLALLLADAGYDVWLLSTRGTTPSMKHLSLNSSDAAFWDYSWHEKGYYDTAASLDYIVDTANVEKVTVIGHSEGTTDSLVLTSSRPEYNDKINLLVLLSPIAYMEDLTSPIILLMVKYMESPKLFFKAINVYGLPYSPLITSVGTALCNDESAFQEICANFLELLCGYDFPQLNKTFLTVMLSNTPAGISTKEIIHYGQEIKSGYFRQYDYGLANYIYYGSRDPPSYDPTKITAPVAAYYAKNDYFAALTDVQKLLDQLPNLVQNFLIEYELFNHLDFILAKDIKTLLYDQVISDIQKHNPVKAK